MKREGVADFAEKQMIQSCISEPVTIHLSGCNDTQTVEQKSEVMRDETVM